MKSWSVVWVNKKVVCVENWDDDLSFEFETRQAVTASAFFFSFFDLS
jgi:hypothetical protein